MRGGEQPSEGSIEIELAGKSPTASFADSFLGDEWCTKLVTKLVGYPHKQILDLRGNNIRGEGAKALADCLRTNRHLTSVCLEWNNVGLLNYGVNALAQSLESNVSITKLDLRNNRISAEGGYALARAIKVNRTLTTIDLRWNDIGPQAGAAFIEALRSNQAIMECRLSGNKISASIS
jgi:Ran GTPase-activating protein (RanGAP) involved in mRNA processing and transport